VERGRAEARARMMARRSAVRGWKSMVTGGKCGGYLGEKKRREGLNAGARGG